MLADYGADVVRVDRPVQPFGPKDSLVRGKRSIVLDLKDKGSRALFLELVKAADVLIDPHRPGVLDRLDLGPTTLHQLNPRLIYAQLSGYRPGSFYGDRAGHDINYLAVSGVLSLLGRKGEKPAPPGNILGDFAGGGLVCLTGILLALLYRQISGRGQLVAANMLDGTKYLATFPRQHLTQPAWNRPRGENLLDGAAPFYEVYETKNDRFVAVGAQEPQFYNELVSGLGFDKSSIPDRDNRENWPILKELFATRFREKTMDEWRAVFDHTDACVTPVLHISETEGPHQPLVHLAVAPSRDVSEQNPFPQLGRGEGCTTVLQQWLPNTSHDQLYIDDDTRVASLVPRSKL